MIFFVMCRKAFLTAIHKTKHLLALCSVICIGLVSVQEAQAVVEWRIAKIVTIQSNWNGDLVLVLDQAVSTSAGCSANNIVVMPKFVTTINMTVPDAYLARMQAMAESAMARNAPVAFGLESSLGCQWGVYAVFHTFSEYRQ